MDDKEILTNNNDNAPSGNSKVTLFKALKHIGFESDGPRRLRREKVVIWLDIGYRSHWYVETPLGTKDYLSQKQALHALVLYHLVNEPDLKRMTKLGYQPAAKELEKYNNTLKSSLELAKSSESRRRKEIIERINLQMDLKQLEIKHEEKRLLNRTIVGLLEKRTTLTDEEPYAKCPVCTRVLYDLERLRQHISDTKGHSQYYQQLIKEAKEILKII